MQMNQNLSVKRGRRNRVSSEQKLAILQQWQAGTPVVELCRIPQREGQRHLSLEE